MPALHAKTPLLVVANARHSPSYGCALRLVRPGFRSLLGHAGLIAIGRGTLTVENSTLNGRSLISLRSDYGSTWEGMIVVRNCRWLPACGAPVQPVLLNASNDGQHDFGYPCFMPREILIDGLTIDDRQHPKDYAGPLLFTDPDGATPAAASRPHRYRETEQITVRRLTTTSGQPFRVSPDAAFNARVIPSVAYTDPEVAWVGLTEDQAKAQGIKVKKGLFPWAASGRAIANGRDEGVTKLLFDDSPEAGSGDGHAGRGHGKILGGGMVGTHAGDMIGEIALAIEMGADAVDIGKTIHPHPTLGESIASVAGFMPSIVRSMPALSLSRIRSTTRSPARLGNVETRTSSSLPPSVRPMRPSCGTRRSAISSR
eukprot:gene41714-56474_t